MGIPVSFLYTNNELCEKEIKIFPFTISSQIRKYWEINITKKVYNSYTKNYNTVIKETGKGTKNWKVLYVHWLEDLIFLMCFYYSKQYTNSILSFIKTLKAFYTEMEKQSSNSNEIINK